MTGIITNYLTQHRRLVVPQLGTFVVKVPEGGVVFSELLKRDDGILRGLLVQQGGMNDLEAAGAIDRFVFEVRHALEHEGAYAIEGFGRLTLSPGGAIVFQAVLATPVAAAGPVVGESAPEEGNKISSAAALHPASVAASAESVAPRVRSRSEAKMLEICPSIAEGDINIRVNPLGLGNREDPARLVFTAKEGDAIASSLIDMGDHFRLVINDITCKKTERPMPNLPVATAFWTPKPDFLTGVEAWLMTGGAHHTVMTYDLTAEQLGDWGDAMGIEVVYIDENTTIRQLKKELKG